MAVMEPALPVAALRRRFFVGMALAILLVALYTQQPLDFSVFPSVLLVIPMGVIADRFDAIVGMDTIGIAKPDGVIATVDLLLVTSLEPHGNGSPRRGRSRRQ